MPYLSTRQVCDVLGISRWKVAELVKDGELEAIKGNGPNGHIKVDENSLKAYIKRRTVRASA